MSFVEIRVVQGRDLVAMDKDTSDPYVVIYDGLGKKVGKSERINKNLNPVWNYNCTVQLPKGNRQVSIEVIDYDVGLANDPMGKAVLDLQNHVAGDEWTRWFTLQQSDKGGKFSGEIEVMIKLSSSVKLAKGEQVLYSEETMTDKARVGLMWDSTMPVDLDASCVFFNRDGGVEGALFYGCQELWEGAAKHGGDDRTGTDAVGDVDDEEIFLDLQRMPKEVYAIFVVATAYAEETDFSCVDRGRARVIDSEGDVPINLWLSPTGNHNALVICRLVRSTEASEGWWDFKHLSELDEGPRDYGGLIPKLKVMLQDKMPDLKSSDADIIKVAPKEKNLKGLTKVERKTFADGTKVESRGAFAEVRVLRGRNLVAMDGLFGKGTSDPFVVVYDGSNQKVGKSPFVKKTLNPEWDYGCNIQLENKERRVRVEIFDYDLLSANDPMGIIEFEFDKLLAGEQRTEWYKVEQSNKGGKFAGDIEVAIRIVGSLNLQKGEDVHYLSDKLTDRARFGLMWESTNEAGDMVDLDASCVFFNDKGEYMDALYYGNTSCFFGLAKHSGDRRRGDEVLGDADDEELFLDLKRMPPDVFAIYIVATAYSEGTTFENVDQARARLIDSEGDIPCTININANGNHTAVVVCRLVRSETEDHWNLLHVQEFENGPRTFGGLVPALKSRLRDLIPEIEVSDADMVEVIPKGDAPTGPAVPVPQGAKMEVATTVASLQEQLEAAKAAKDFGLAKKLKGEIAAAQEEDLGNVLDASEASLAAAMAKDDFDECERLQTQIDQLKRGGNEALEMMRQEGSVPLSVGGGLEPAKPVVTADGVDGEVKTKEKGLEEAMASDNFEVCEKLQSEIDKLKQGGDEALVDMHGGMDGQEQIPPTPAEEDVAKKKEELATKEPPKPKEVVQSDVDDIIAKMNAEVEEAIDNGEFDNIDDMEEQIRRLEDGGVEALSQMRKEGVLPPPEPEVETMEEEEEESSDGEWDELADDHPEKPHVVETTITLDVDHTKVPPHVFEEEYGPRYITIVAEITGVDRDDVAIVLVEEGSLLVTTTIIAPKEIHDELADILPKQMETDVMEERMNESFGWEGDMRIKGIGVGDVKVHIPKPDYGPKGPRCRTDNHNPKWRKQKKEKGDAVKKVPLTEQEQVMQVPAMLNKSRMRRKMSVSMSDYQGGRGIAMVPWQEPMRKVRMMAVPVIDYQGNLSTAMIPWQKRPKPSKDEFAAEEDLQGAMEILGLDTKKGKAKKKRKKKGKMGAMEKLLAMAEEKGHFEDPSAQGEKTKEKKKAKKKKKKKGKSEAAADRLLGLVDKFLEEHDTAMDELKVPEEEAPTLEDVLILEQPEEPLVDLGTMNSGWPVLNTLLATNSAGQFQVANAGLDGKTYGCKTIEVASDEQYAALRIGVVFHSLLSTSNMVVRYHMSWEELSEEDNKRVVNIVTERCTCTLGRVLMNDADEAPDQTDREVAVRRPSTEEAVKWSFEVLRALSTIQQNAVIHRKLDPSSFEVSVVRNIHDQIVRSVKLGEFSSCVRRPRGGQLKGFHAHGAQSLTKDDMVSPYSAPELGSSRHGGYDQTVDVFSAGMIMFSIWQSSQLVPSSELQLQLMVLKQTGELPEDFDSPYAYGKLLKKMVAKVPKERASVAECMFTLHGLHSRNAGHVEPVVDEPAELPSGPRAGRRLSRTISRARSGSRGSLQRRSSIGAF